MYYKRLLVYPFSITIWAGCTKEEIEDSVDYEVILENHLRYSEAETIPEQVMVIKNGAD